MSKKNNGKDKKDEFDPEKKISEASDDSFSNEGWLRDEKWSILTDGNGKPLLLADGADSDSDGSNGDGGDSCASCKGCTSSSGDGN